MYGTLSTIETQIPLSEYRERYLDIERFHGFCRRCDNYGQQWVCPPFDFSIEEVLDRYDRAIIFGHRLDLRQEVLDLRLSPEGQRAKAHQIGAWVRSQIDAPLLEREAETPRSLAFYAGKCYVCGDRPCARLEEAPCRYPERARHSLENFGFDLMRTASELLHTPMLWSKEGRFPEYYFYISALLLSR